MSTPPNQAAYSQHTAQQYQQVHGDIFNDIEQARLRRTLQLALDALLPRPSVPVALDYGCGSGNLTRHLLDLGCHTVSADVTASFLQMIQRELGHLEQSETRRLNGEDLSDIDDHTYDLVATYSVLHHVPDYLRMVAEFARVVKPGGVVYMDHEVTASYYDRPPAYQEFLRLAKPRWDWPRYLRLLLDVPGYVHIVRRLRNPRYKREGDIHVWPDDRIEWERIEAVLQERGLEIVHQEDYLLYRKQYRWEIYQAYQDRCADEHVLIARKKVRED